MWIKEPLIDSAAHLRHIFSRLLLTEKLDVHPVHLAFFAIADEKICTESVPPHSISVSLILLDSMVLDLAFLFSFRLVNTLYQKRAKMQEKFLKIICTEKE